VLLLASAQALAASSGFPERPADVEPESWASLRAAVEEAKLLPRPEGVGGQLSSFGSSVSVDGNRALVSGTALAGSGAALVLIDTGSGWQEEAVLLPSNGETGDAFGNSVSLSGDRALVGALADDDEGDNSGAAYVFDFDGTSWIQTAKLTAADGADFDSFGISVSLSGDRALVGAQGDDDNGTDSGSAYVFDFDGSSWAETVKLTPTDGVDSDFFGFSVSLAGDRALVGAYFDDDNGSASGSAYVFDFNGTSWAETAKFTPADGATSDQFGHSVSLSGDRALVGAFADSDNGTASGSAYVFDFDGTNWDEAAKLTPADGADFDNFGISVSLSGDRALVGAWRDDDNGTESGSAYVFDFDGSSWAETVKLTPTDGAEADRFGGSVSLSGDRALISAFLDDDNGINSGSAYVLDFDGTNWNVADKLTADGAAGDQFGWSVSLSGDRALVGAPSDGDNGTASGSAYVFDFDGTNWNEAAKLTPGDGAGFEQFGRSVSLFGDRALVGAWRDGDNGSASGSAYVFEFDGTKWIETEKLLPSDGAAGDRFGVSVSVSGDRALIGAYLDDDKGRDSGSAYVFDFDGTDWSQTAKFTSGDGAANDQFGYSVSVSGDRALIGAFSDDENGSFSGSAYVFDFDGTNWEEMDKLVPIDGAASDQFGYSVSLSGDRALVGARVDADNGSQSGSAYVFDFDGTNWSEADKLVPSDGAASDQFGYSVSQAGDRALIGAIGDDDYGGNSGTAYVFGLGGNRPPIAQPDAVATDEDTVLVGDVLADNGSGIDDDPDGDPLTVIEVDGVAASVGTPITLASGALLTVEATGAFTYSPPDDANGIDPFDYTLGDEAGATDTATVTITVAPVNDPPTFTPGGGVTGFENTPFDAPWASAISPGPADESSQSVTFLVNPTSNPGLFAAGPAVDASGRLTFTPAADTLGTAEVEVVAMDDGGLANGGDDTSSTATFTIEVIQAADLAIDKTSGSFFTPPGGALAYELVVTNPGPSDVVGARIEDPEPARLMFGNWQCAPTGLATCDTATGSGPVDVLVTIPEGDSITVSIDAQLTDLDATPVTNIASVTTPAGIEEINAADNVDSDTDPVGLFVDSFESVEPD
jgi:hypothetical protein